MTAQLRDLPYLTDEALVAIVEEYEALHYDDPRNDDADYLARIDAAERELEQRVYANHPDEGVRIGTGNYRGGPS